MTTSHYHSNTNEVTLKEACFILKKNWLKILGTSLFTGTLTALVLMAMPTNTTIYATIAAGSAPLHNEGMTDSTKATKPTCCSARDFESMIVNEGFDGEVIKRLKLTKAQADSLKFKPVRLEGSEVLTIQITTADPEYGIKALKTLLAIMQNVVERDFNVINDVFSISVANRKIALRSVEEYIARYEDRINGQIKDIATIEKRIKESSGSVSKTLNQMLVSKQDMLARNESTIITLRRDASELLSEIQILERQQKSLEPIKIIQSPIQSSKSKRITPAVLGIFVFLMTLALLSLIVIVFYAQREKSIS